MKYKNPTGKDIQSKEFEMENDKYEMFKNNLEEKEPGRGQLIYVDKRLNAERLTLKTPAEEVLAVQIKRGNGENLIVALFYRSPSSQKENNKKIRQEINELCEKYNTEIVMMGDFNYKEINCEEDTGKGTEQEKFLECIQQNLLTQHVREATRFRGDDTPSRVDLIFASEEDMIKDIEYKSPLGRSDHKTIVFKINIDITREWKEETKWLYKKANISEMKKEIEEIDWENELKVKERSMDEILEAFSRILNTVMEKHIPTTKVQKGKSIRPPIDNKMNELMKEKDKAGRKVSEGKKTGSKYEYDKAKKVYNRARNKVRGYSRKLRKEFEEEIAGNAKENMKQVFAYINSKSKKKGMIGKICTDPEDEKSEKTEDDNEKAKIFSKFFISVQTEESGEIPNLEVRRVRIPMTKVEVTEKRVKELLKEMREDKSEGPDRKSPRVLKPLAEVLYKPLTIIFRESVERGVVPREWKIAWITVIYKQGKKYLAGNYRPVSLTSILSKMLEKIIRDHMVEHMVKNNLFSNGQYGFIKGRSTVLQLLCAMESWTEAMDNGNKTDCIYTDFKKAFDKVPHKRLLKKVRAYGIEENICKWIEDFLKDRSQRVTVNGTRSEWEKVKSGVPQGTVLGPILFIIYINDLPEILESLLFLFADDSKIWREIKEEEDKHILQSDLMKMKEWSIKWMLEFHPDKLKHLHISSSWDEEEFVYYVGDDPAKKVGKEKDLGVTVDYLLNFENHMSTKVKKANSMMGMIRRTFQFLNTKTFLPLYKALVRNGLEYGEAVWSPHKMKDIEKIEGVQRRATKLLPGMKERSYQERLKILRLPTLRHRRIRGDMIETYKILHGIYDKEVTPKLILKKELGKELRGNTMQLHQQRTRLDIRKYSFTHRIVPIWNSLSKEVVTAPSVNAFKGRLDKWWRNKEAVYNYKKDILSEE